MKKIVFIFLIILALIFMYYYHTYYKFYRKIYYKEDYLIENQRKYLKNVKVNDIKNPFFQTYYNKSKIPKDIYSNISKYASDYTHIIMDDNDIKNFLKKYYTDIVFKTFDSLKNGAHKADLARYCILYIYGGIYMDIKVELLKPISYIFNKGDDVFYTVDSVVKDTVHQGILKSPKNNPIFLSLIDYIVMTQNPFRYADFCRDLYIQIENDTSVIKQGLSIGKSGNKYYFFQEKCSSTDSSMCYDGFDRYGLCCFVWDGNIPVIKLRRSSYPWK